MKFIWRILWTISYVQADVELWREGKGKEVDPHPISHDIAF